MGDPPVVVCGAAWRKYVARPVRVHVRFGVRATVPERTRISSSPANAAPLTARPIVVGAAISALGDALIPIAFAIHCHRTEPAGWGLAVVLVALWAGRFTGATWARRTPGDAYPVRTMTRMHLARAAAQLGLLVVLAIIDSDATGTAVIAMAVSSYAYGFAAALFVPAQFQALSLVCQGDALVRANSVLAAIGSVSAVVGPIAGASAVLWLGFDLVILIDGATFCVAALALLPLRRVSTQPATGTTHAEAAKSAAGAVAHDNARSGAGTNMPGWFAPGVAMWAVVMFTIGVLGVAGPTHLLDRFGVTGWTIVATSLGVGGLIGSMSTILGLVQKLGWRTLAGDAAACMALQSATFTVSPYVWLAAAAAVCGSLSVSFAGIRWDTMGQSLPSGASVREFATVDQLVTTSAVPAGMVAFGIAGALGGREVLLWGLAGTCVAAGLVVALATPPRDSDFR